MKVEEVRGKDEVKGKEDEMKVDDVRGKEDEIKVE